MLVDAVMQMFLFLSQFFWWPPIFVLAHMGIIWSGFISS